MLNFEKCIHTCSFHLLDTRIDLILSSDLYVVFIEDGVYSSFKSSGYYCYIDPSKMFNEFTGKSVFGKALMFDSFHRLGHFCVASDKFHNICTGAVKISANSFQIQYGI